MAYDLHAIDPSHFEEIINIIDIIDKLYQFLFDIGYDIVLQCRDITSYKDIEGKNFDVVHDIGAMSGYKDIEVSFSISIFKDFVDIGYDVPYLGQLGAPATLHACRRVQPPGPRPAWTVCTLG
jgi:hypothetical protein